MTNTPIGTTKGPGETPHEFTFVAPDPEQRVKYGEFVYYQADVEGQPRDILGRVVRREPLRLYPDTFMADPAVPPQVIARLLGFEPETHELYEVTATVIGYHDPAMGFVNPRVPPRSGAPIYIASDELLTRVLSRRERDTVGSVHIGSLLSRPLDRVPIVLDGASFTSTHLAIIASTGSGKSYLAGVILEELMRPTNRAAVLVVDPHGEYDTLDEIRNEPSFRADGYEPEVKVVRPNQIKVRVSSLELGDLRYLLPNLTERMHYLLGRAYNSVRRKHQEKWTRAHLLVEIRAGLRDAPVTDPNLDDELDEDPTVGALIWRVNSVLGASPIFDDVHDQALHELLRPGQLTVLQLNEIPEREQQIIVATLLRRLLRARMDTERGLVPEGDDRHLPYPAFVLIEEAHNYAPANAEIITTQILKQILSEGRKFGVAVGLISQRPGKLDSDVLSQCMTQCIMRIVNPVDQARVAESVESVGRDLLAELPALTKGQVIVAGAAVNTPVMARVRQRLTRHGAEDLNAPERWQEFYSEENVRRRERDDARPPDTPERRGRGRMFLPV